MSAKLRKFIKIGLITLGLLIILLSIKDLLPLLKSIITSSMSNEGMVDYLSEFGHEGIFLLFTLNVIPQLIVFIPQIPVTILTGLCYGTLRGALISMVGQLFGIGLLYIFLRNLRQPLTKLINKYAKGSNVEKAKELFNKIKFLPKRAGYLIIICFYLIPGLPSTLTPFIFAWTNCSLMEFLICVMIGSTPSTLMYCYSGELVQMRNWKLLLIVLFVILIIALILYNFREGILDFLLERKNKDSD